MENYDSLPEGLRECIERALDDLKDSVAAQGVRLAADDRASRAADALARYIRESME